MLRSRIRVKDSEGNIVELRCSYDPDTLSGMAGAARKVKGTLHWVSAQHAVDAEVGLHRHSFHLVLGIVGNDHFKRIHNGHATGGDTVEVVAEYFVKELADESYCPRQIEFNRLNLTYTVMSKRKL